jgi:hypothetical protein
MISDYNRNHKMPGSCSNVDLRVFDDLNCKGVERRIAKDKRKGRQKRKVKRYKVKDLVYVKLRSESKIDIGKILDISEGGISFQYVANAEKLRDYSTFGISTIGKDLFSINRIRSKSISDIELTNASPFNLTKLRRHSLKFGNLTSRQMFKIENFLLNYTSCKT